HTRFSRDWSSDVCSSDLGDPAVDPPQLGCCEVGGRLEIAPLVLVGPVVSHLATHPRERELVSRRGDVRQLTERSPTNRLLPNVEIGRASCRDRAEPPGGG